MVAVIKNGEKNGDNVIKGCIAMLKVRILSCGWQAVLEVGGV